MGLKFCNILVKGILNLYLVNMDMLWNRKTLVNFKDKAKDGMKFVAQGQLLWAQPL